MPMQYTAILQLDKSQFPNVIFFFIIFPTFAQDINCEYTIDISEYQKSMFLSKTNNMPVLL